MARVLVLGDPDAFWCKTLLQLGYDVTCCPDRQGLAHASSGPNVIEEIHHLLGLRFEFDFAIAIDGFRRIQDTHTGTELNKLHLWLGHHVKCVFMEAPRRVLAPDLHDHGPYRVRELRHFYQFISEVWSGPEKIGYTARPVLALSNQGLWLRQWIQARDLRALPHSWHAEPTTHTFEFGDSILKIEYASSGDFERCEVQDETSFLLSASDEVKTQLSLPSVLDCHSGRAVSWLQRTAVKGVALTKLEHSRDPLLSHTILYWAYKTSTLGLFHNDIRPWNLLWDGQTVHAIDFSDTSTFDNDVSGLPQIVSLCGTILACQLLGTPLGPDFVPFLMQLVLESGIQEHWSLTSLFDDPWLNLKETYAPLSRILAEINFAIPEVAMKLMLETLMEGQHENIT
jgi:hypothetical protein